MTKIPVMELVKHAYGFTLRNFGYAIKISWAWVLLIILAIVALGAIGLAIGLRDISELGSPNFFTASAIALAILLIFLLLIMAYGSIGVAWFRRVLLEERIPGFFNLAADGPVWAFIGYYFLIWIILSVLMGVGFGAIGLIASTAGETAGVWAAFLLGIPGIIFIIFLGLRWSMVFPAAAVGLRGFGLSGSWGATKGNVWRLIGGMLLVVVPLPLLIGGLQAIVIAAASDGAAAAIIAIIGALMNFYISFSAYSFLAGAFRHLVPPDNA